MIEGKIVLTIVPSIITSEIDIEIKTKPIQRFFRAATSLPSAFKIQKRSRKTTFED